MISNIFIKDIKWLALAQIFLRAKGLIVIPLITHSLGATNYGVWTQIIAVAALAMPFIIWGMNRGFIRYASGEDIDKQLSLYNAWLSWVFFWVLVVAIPIVLFRDEISSFVLQDGTDGSELILFTIGWCLANGLFQTFTVWLQASGQSAFFSIALVLQSLFSLLAIILYLLLDGSLMLLVSLTVGVELLFIFSLLVHHFFKYGWHRPDYSQLKVVFLFSYPLMPITFANLGINWGDRVVLLQYLTISDIGIYNLIHGLAMMIVQTITQPIRSYYPARSTKLYLNKKFEDLQVLYNLSAGTLFAFYIPSILGLFFISPYFLSIMAPAEFSIGAYLLPILFAGYALDRLCTYNQQYLEWTFKPVWITVSLFGCFALNFILNLILVPRYGLIGAGLASVIAFAARYLFIWILVRGSFPLKNNPLYVVKICISGLLMMVGLWAMEDIIVALVRDNFVFSNLVILLIFLLLGGVIYAAMLLLFGVLSIQKIMNFFQPSRAR